MSEATQPDGIVTPEAVLIDVERAGVGSRSVAMALDLLLVMAVSGLVALAMAIFSVQAGSSWVGTAVLTVAGFVALYGYAACFEGFMGGRTPGKAAVGLRVLTVEGTPIRFRHAAVRSAIGLVEIFLSAGTIGLVTMFLSRGSQRLGDMAAGTIVVRERSAAAAPSSTRFVPPPAAQEFAATLDVADLTAEDYRLVRSYLLRAGAMTAQAREQLGAQLATTMLRKLRVQVPDGMPAYLFLLCIAAAIQRRSR